MKKKLLTLLLTLTACFTLVGCEFSLIPEISVDTGSIGTSDTGSSDSSSGGSSDSSSGGSSDSSSGGSSDSSSGGSSDSSSGGSSDSSSGGSSDSSSGGQEGEKDEIKSLLESAYALASGQTLSGTHTLTGVVTDVEKRSQGDICLTITVTGYEQYPMYCYWLQDADFIEDGDTVTVKGKIKNYNGLIEFEKPTLVSFEKGEGNGGNQSGTGYTYTDFTSSEKQLLISEVGEVIPFVPNNEYYLESDTDEYGPYLSFYTIGNTQSDFNAYRAKFTAYTLDETYEDTYGDTWYVYVKGDLVVEMSFYYYDGDYVIDVYIYLDGETGGSSGGSGNTGGGSSSVDLITNEGKGLPTRTDGVYNVDFTKATNVKNVTEQGYYLDGCPTVGSPAVLVIPVEFKDVTASSKGYTTDKIRAAFCGEQGATDYYSVKQYYTLSSYGKLNLDITVLDEWFRPANNSSYYKNATYDYYGDEVLIGDQLIMDEALAYLASKMDLSDFDSDGNGIIDSVVLINTLDINSDNDFHWAYRYWNIYTDAEGYYYEYDGVSANDYLWASYEFMYENEEGEFTATNALNTYTYIHEFGHILGADDYYDTSYTGSPMDGNDIMDAEIGDHNAYTKFNYGWLTASRLVVAEGSVTLSLDAFSKNGDTIIIANDWDETLGAYQEYFILVYYTNGGLNGGMGGYFEEEGVVVYHVNASLYRETIEGTTYYDVYNNNTDVSDPDGYGTEDNLIELVKSSDGDYVFTAGETLSANTKTSSGKKIAYLFTVTAVGEKVTLTFTKNN